MNTAPRKARTVEQQRAINAITHRKAPAGPATPPRAAAFEPPHHGSIYERHDLASIEAKRTGTSDAARLAARPGRVRGVCLMYGLPETVIAEINAAGLSVKHAAEILQAATGAAGSISPAGITQVRLSVAAARRAAPTAAPATPDRAAQITALCEHHGVTGTRLAQALAACTVPVDRLAAELARRPHCRGRLDGVAQNRLTHDLKGLTL